MTATEVRGTMSSTNIQEVNEMPSNLTIQMKDDELFRRMKKLEWVNWSGIFRAFVKNNIDKLEVFDKQLRWIDHEA